MTITFSGGMTVTGGGVTAAGTNLLQVVDQVSGNVLTLPTGVSVSTAVTQTGTTSSMQFANVSTAILTFTNSNVAVIPVTVEYWYYPTTSDPYVTSLGMSQNSNKNTGAQWSIDILPGAPGVGTYDVYFTNGTSGGGGGGGISGAGVTINAWNFIAVQVTTTQLFLWINGTYQGSYPSSTLAFPGGYEQSAYSNLQLGSWDSYNLRAFTGYMNQVRVSSGQRYSSSTITVPSSPLTVDGTTVALIQSVVK